MELLGEPVTVWVCVDENHEGNLANRRSHLGILIYVNNAMINFYRKRHNTVESSSFDLEFVALRIATDRVKALMYKIRKFFVNLEGPSEVYCDNK